MRIELAGYNVDSSILNGARRALGDKDIWTPETISAAYARISRSDKDATELRSDAIQDVESARKSNTKIVHDMGHSSIAEHSVFNFDIIDISRLAAEYIQRHRLISFTEKSQRYTMSKNSYVLPQEFDAPNDKYKVIELIESQFDAYNVIYRQLIGEGYSEQEAKEDARYILPLCAVSQMGMTINARNLEMIIQRLYSYNIIELNDIAKTLFELSSKIVPSLIKYTDPTPYMKNAKDETDRYVQNTLGLKKKERLGPNDPLPKVILIDYPEQKLDKLVEAILFNLGYGPYCHCEFLTSSMSKLSKEAILFNSMKDIGIHDSLGREFELIDLIFELNISASCYAQLKRHRMTTQITSPYTQHVIVPESINIHCGKLFMETVEKTNSLYRSVSKVHPVKVCEYILTNSHSRRVMLKTNLREFDHIKKLRTDNHAQWEIRNIVNEMISKSQEYI